MLSACQSGHQLFELLPPLVELDASLLLMHGFRLDWKHLVVGDLGEVKLLPHFCPLQKTGLGE